MLCPRAQGRLTGVIAVVLLQLGLLAFLLRRQHSLSLPSILTATVSSGSRGVLNGRAVGVVRRRLPQPDAAWSSPFHSALPGKRVPRASLPNILLAIADDLPRTALGAYGSPLGVTPAIDALGASGRRLDEVHTPSPLCTPSRVALLTGRHASCAYYGRQPRSLRQMRLDGTVGASFEVPTLGFNLVLSPGLGSGEQRHANSSLPANATAGHWGMPAGGLSGGGGGGSGGGGGGVGSGGAVGGGSGGGSGNSGVGGGGGGGGGRDGGLSVSDELTSALPTRQPLYKWGGGGMEAGARAPAHQTRSRGQARGDGAGASKVPLPRTIVGKVDRSSSKWLALTWCGVQTWYCRVNPNLIYIYIYIRTYLKSRDR